MVETFSLFGQGLTVLVYIHISLVILKCLIDFVTSLLGLKLKC